MKRQKEIMKWNSDEQAYFGVTSDGLTIRVEGIEYAETEQDGCPQEELDDPDQWATCIGANQNVEIIGKAHV